MLCCWFAFIFAVMIETERLFLVPANLPMLEAIASEDWPALSALLGGVDLAPHWMHFPEAMIWFRDFLRETRRILAGGIISLSIAATCA